MADGTPALVTETTSEFLARLDAQDADGNVDPLAREAGRLVLDSRAVGGVDATRLVRSMVASPAYVSGRKRSQPMIDAIASRLDPLSARRFERALDHADITDTAFESTVEKTGGGLFGIGRFLVKAVHWVDDRISDGLSAARQWADRVASDENANPLVRVLAGIVEKPVELAQTAYGVVKAPVMRITGAVEDVAEVGKFAWRFASNEHYREALFAMAKLQVIESVGEPGNVAGDIAVKAVRSLDELKDGLENARAEGKEAEYLARLAGENGLKVFSQVLPSAALEKLDLLANTLDEISLDEVPEIREALGDAAQAIARGGAAGEAGTQVWRSLMQEFREDGELAALVDIARDNGSLDTMLQLGELSPRELTDLLKLDPSLFSAEATGIASLANGQPQAAGASFEEALNASIRNLDLSTLQPREAGELAEAIVTRDMLRNGYTEIAALENRTGDGITLAGRNAGGGLESFEVDSAAIARAAHALPRDGDGIDVARFATLIEADPRLPRHKATTQAPIRSAGIDGNDNPYAGLAQAGSMLDDPAHGQHALHAQASDGVHVLDARLGRTPDISSNQLSGALAVAARQAGLDRIDHVVISDDAKRVFAVQGDLDSPLRRIASVDTVTATHQSMARSTAMMAQLDADQPQQQARRQAQTQQSSDDMAYPARAAIAI